MRLLLLLALPALFAAPALTASSGVPPTAAGSGSGAISGYTVSAISYELEGDMVGAVSFSLSPPGASTVRARLAPEEPWVSCALLGGVASCPVATPLAAASSLDVVAARKRLTDERRRGTVDRAVHVGRQLRGRPPLRRR